MRRSRGPWHRFIPANLSDPVGLAARLLKTRDGAARFSMALAVGGLAATPLDLLLLAAERRLYARASLPTFPIVFVVGPPRSGTTLSYQLLLHHFDVRYLNNLSAVFPRSPIMANRIFNAFGPSPELDFQSYYGRTSRLSGSNDGLHIWDRWFDRTRLLSYENLTLDDRDRIGRFWGAFEAVSGRPIVNKNNSLIAGAHRIAEALPTSYFICLERNPVYLAQSLYRARQVIHGDLSLPYGLHHPERRQQDPVEDVCAQVRFHQDLAAEQQDKIGSDRFRIVAYEDVCTDPRRFLEQTSRDLPELDGFRREPKIQSFQISEKVYVERDVFERIAETFQAVDYQ